MLDYCSIYKITNNFDDKIYIGQTWNRLNARFNEHCCHRDHFSKITNAIKKYGKDKFEIEPIVCCNNQAAADYLETFWINTYDSINTGYNIKNGGSKGRQTEETRVKIRQWHKEHPMKNMLGKHHSEASKEKNRLAHLGKSKYASEEEKRIARCEATRRYRQKNRSAS